ncbi:MAG TPA: radical SAM protein [Methanomicrobiales archaeon]|nr:radical SAM protein [Methanomicrobiales archaeon]
MKAYGPSSQRASVPQIISWNVTFMCPLRCGHCYIDAGARKGLHELTTREGKTVIDRIAEVSLPILVLSGGEPLMRRDIFELSSYASERGLRVALGTSGTLITDRVAAGMKDAGIRSVAISLDSVDPDLHDSLRGVSGAWEKAVKGIEAAVGAGIPVQLNAAVGPKNCGEMDAIIDLGKSLGVQNFQVFFLVPTGRGKGVEDISPEMYESVIRTILEKGKASGIRVRPTCAPQFVRIADEMGISNESWGRGCIAGLTYCRIYPTGEVTPCPYLPISLGNVLSTSFREIWYNSPVLQGLRNPDMLQGKCGRCSYRTVCGGCRARAYGISRRAGDLCGGLDAPQDAPGEYLGEDPWCLYDPNGEEGGAA